MPARVAILGDFDPDMHTHQPLLGALRPAEAAWVATGDIDEALLEACDGLVLAPGSPYADFDRALGAIAFARRTGVPFLGICGGFQHVWIEYARNVAGWLDADSVEHGAHTQHAVIVPAVCRLEGQHEVEILPGTRLAAVYGEAGTQQETYYCGFVADAQTEASLAAAGLRVNARAADGTPRGCELPDLPFFLATAFQPQMKPGHPVLAAFVAAAGQRALHRAWSCRVAAADYEQHMTNTGQAQANAALSGRLLEGLTGSLLVAGAGPGQMLEHGLTLAGFAPTFTDVNAAFLDELRRRLEAKGWRGETLHDDLTNSTLVGTFDAALIVLVLEHVDWRRALQTLARLARHWLIIIQRNPAGMASAVTPGVLPPGTMRQFAGDTPPHLVPEEALIAEADGLGYRVTMRHEAPVRDGKVMVGLRFDRV